MQPHAGAQLKQASNRCHALLFDGNQGTEWASHPINHTCIGVQHRAAQLWAHADQIGIKCHECLVDALPCLGGAHERKGGGIGAVSGWGCQTLTLSAPFHKDAPLSHGDELVK